MMTHTPILMPTLDCLHKHMFLLYVYRSIYIARMRRHTQLAYLFNQCATSLLSRDCRIADCSVKHPGVERPFSSHISNCHEDRLCSGMWRLLVKGQYFW